MEKLTRTIWGAYEYLQDNDLSLESGTSQRLRAGERDKLRARLLEELSELRGVIEGTHFHEGFEQDLVLEGYEVWYWMVCLSIASGMTYDELLPHRALLAGFQSSPVDRSTILPAFDNLHDKINRLQPYDDEVANLTQVLCLVGRACGLNATPPSRLLERDQAEMSQKLYLIPYWQKQRTASFAQYT